MHIQVKYMHDTTSAYKQSCNGTQWRNAMRAFGAQDKIKKDENFFLLTFFIYKILIY